MSRATKIPMWPPSPAGPLLYKGMFLVGQLRNFYLDLQDEDYESAIALVHSRFSTNTNPSWERAHPNRFILHNGEINTIRGNADRMLSREETMTSPLMAEAADRILPVINGSGSDSAMLDNTLEFMVMNGMDLPLAMMILIPEAWRHNKHIDRQRQDLYHYYATMMEPWDGPASIVFSDGDLVGALLDRNGLRPSRYYVTRDNYLILSSEVGVLDIDPAMVVKKDRLRPARCCWWIPGREDHRGRRSQVLLCRPAALRRVAGSATWSTSRIWPVPNKRWSPSPTPSARGSNGPLPIPMRI